MSRNFLVALDGSRRSLGVFHCAVDLAESIEASLHLLRAVAVPPEFPPAGHVSHADALSGYLMTRAEADLRAFAARAPHLRIETIVRDSSQPWRTIVDVADEIDASMIIVGSHGYHGIDYLLGTTAGKVANLASRNVLVVHHDPDARVSTPWRPRPG